MPEMPFYPDQPKHTISYQGIGDVVGDFIVQPKFDGWRALVVIDDRGEVSCWSRHGELLPVSDAVAAPYAAFGKVGGAVFDAEWMGRRSQVGRERLVAFDLLALGAINWRLRPAYERVSRLSSLAMCAQRSAQAIEAAPCRRTGNTAEIARIFKDWQATMPECEGVVLKAAIGTYIGARRPKTENPTWFRCKWRAGEAGTTMVA